MLGGKLVIGMGIAMLVMGGLFGLYYKLSQATIATLNQEVSAQQARAASAEANLKFIQESLQRQQESLDRLTEASVIIRKEQKATIDIFAEHDLNKLVSRKPGLIERRVNKGTMAVFAELELLSDPNTYHTLPDKEFVKDEK